MKKILLCVLAVALAAGLTACALPAAESTPTPTAVPTPTPTAETTPTPTPTPTPSPTPRPTPRPTPTPTPTPGPLDISQEPPLDEFSLSVPVPDFLTEEQQLLYRKAHFLYRHMFGGDTSAIDGGAMGTYYEEVRIGNYCYNLAQNRYRNWEEFDAVVHSVFTDRFWDERNDTSADFPIYRNFDGRMGFIWYVLGADGDRNENFPDTFELLEQTGDMIRFHVVGYYSDIYPQEYEVTPDGEWDYAARDERLKNGYEYERRYEIVLLRMPEGWRFDEFHDTLADEE